jgi:hypothetical protein
VLALFNYENEATDVVFPLPEHEVALETEYFGRTAALEAARSILAGPLKPVCVAVVGPREGRWNLVVGLAGRREVLEVESEHALRLVGDARRFDGLEARRRIEELRDLETRSTLSAALLKGEVANALAMIDAVSDSTPVLIHPGVASIFVEAATPGLPDLARGIAGLGASVEIGHVPLATRAAFDPLELVPAPARELMARVKVALDPARRFASPRQPETSRRG